MKYLKSLVQNIKFKENQKLPSILHNTTRKFNALYLDLYTQKIAPRSLPDVLLGFRFYQQKKYKEAKKVFYKLVHKQPDNAYLNFRYGMVLYKMQDWEGAYFYIKRAIELNPKNSSWKIQLVTAEKNMHNKEKVVAKADIAHYKSEAEKNPNDSECIFAYAEALFSGKQYWMAKAQFEKYISLEPFSEHAYSQLGKICEKLTDYNQAIHYFGLASDINPMNWGYKYRIGYGYECLGDDAQAQLLYDLAISLSHVDDKVRQHGIGIVHFKRGLWLAASKAYESWIANQVDNNLDPEIYQHLGVSYDRQYRWQEAAKAFEKAIMQSPVIRAGWCFSAGQAYERAHDYLNAEKFYRQAVRHSSDYKDYWYFRLGFVCEKNGRMAESNHFYHESRRRKIPHAVSPKGVVKNKEEEFLSYYTEYYETLEIDDSIIMFESFLASSISCNPYAILRYLIDNNYGFTYVVVLSAEVNIPEKLQYRDDVIFVRRNSDLYLRMLCQAKYLVNNVSFPFYFIRKPGQLYLNTWHGTPMKTLGKDIKTPFADYGNVARNFLQATHLISPNRHTTDVMLDRYDIKDIYSGKIAETGYPRIDLTINLSNERKKYLKKELGITDDRPVVFYAPTWRGDSQSKNFDTEKLQQDLKRLRDDSYHLIFRGHHFIEKFLKDVKLDVIVAPSHLDSNELLGLTDVLISDYSSIVYDFLALNRSVICYIYDFDEYKQNRGLYFDAKDMPGEICQDIDELKKTVLKNLKIKHGNINEESIRQYACFDDGMATKRVVDFFLNGNCDSVYQYTKRKTNLFFVGPFLSNGICASFINILQALESLGDADVNNMILINPHDMVGYKERLAEFDKLPSIVTVYPRLGRMPMTLEEIWVRHKFEETFTYYSSEFIENLNRIYQRESRRLFGDSFFDNVINFEGYNLFWVMLISQIKTNNRLIFQHNDKYKEWKTKFPYLQGVFKSYQYYDKIVSVSEKTMENNIKNLQEFFDIPLEKFTFCNNSINIDHILSNAEQEVDFELSFTSFTGYKFLTVGRMSHEKDQMKLIRAFKQIRQTHDDVRLFIIGSGPLEQDIKQLIQELQLENDVYLLGQKLNPFPYLKQADAFVLPSNHEGQPMVLLEALTLHKPIIATDIVGNRSILGDEYGLLVENSEAGLIFGMNEFINGNLDADLFDAYAYQREVVERFNLLIGC